MQSEISDEVSGEDRNQPRSPQILSCVLLQDILQPEPAAVGQRCRGGAGSRPTGQEVHRQEVGVRMAAEPTPQG